MKQKKIKMPFILRFIRTAFPVAERISPGFASWWARRLFFKPLRFPYPEREKAYLENADTFYIEVNGKKVKCYSLGEGKPVLFVHGWSGRASQFWKFAEVFPRYGYRVISFDAPGHGHSTGSSTSVVEFADIIAFLADNYNIKILIGHSLGGVASLLAIKDGTPADHLLMISSPSIADEIINEFLLRINASSKSGDGIRRYVEKLTSKSFEEFMSLHLIKQVNGISLKIIHDEEDRQVSIDHAFKLLEEYPDAEFVKTKGLGHNRILANEEVVQESLLFTSMS